MDFDSPDVEKDFPGLYASEAGGSRKKDESDFSEGDHDKVSKKDLLIGRRKDKKDKKDRGYAALEGESSPEDEPENTSKKKSKAFKFPTKSKEKREKSRDKEKIEVKEKEKEAPELKETKKKDKDKKEKDKKDKSKDKESNKKDKKSKQGSVSEEVLELGDVQPIFGVSLGLAVERSRCHDSVNLPLVVRDCIDYLQEHALQSDQIFKTEPVKSRMQSLRKLYNNRVSVGTKDFDISTGCGLLKIYLQELPEPILTTDLSARFEEAAALPQVAQQESELFALVEQLPSCNQTLLGWIILHLDAITQNEKFNKMNAQSLAMLLSPVLQMSHRLLVALLCFCSNLFADITLHKYIPPITSTSPDTTETRDEITIELCKQESLLAQLHSEMNAGCVSKKREEQLWEVQRIITQLKRKLRAFEKKNERNVEEPNDVVDSKQPAPPSVKEPLLTSKSNSDDEADKSSSDVTSKAIVEKISESPEVEIPIDDNPPMDENVMHVNDAGFMMLPEGHPDYLNLIRLQLENQELLAWQLSLQTRINAERAENLRLRKILTGLPMTSEAKVDPYPISAEDERLIAQYLKENALLEQKKFMLAREVFEENRDLIEMKINMNLMDFV